MLESQKRHFPPRTVLRASQVAPVVTNLPARAGDARLRGGPWVRKILWSRKGQSTPLFLAQKIPWQRSLMSYSPWGCKESDPTECTPVRLEKIHHELSVHTALCSSIKMTGMPTAVEMGNLVVCRAEGGHVRISMCLECPTKDPYPYLWPLRVARLKTSYQKETKWKQFRHNHVNSCEHTSARFASVSKLVSLPLRSSRYYYSWICSIIIFLKECLNKSLVLFINSKIIEYD